MLAAGDGDNMDPELYKDFKTKTVRGFTYHCYCRPVLDSIKPSLLLLHGFPSTSTDRTGIVEFLSKEGYGLLVPDLLGYGGTDKPTDPDAYRMKNIVKDVVDILDSEKQDKVVAISHDWGGGLSSRLLNYLMSLTPWALRGMDMQNLVIGSSLRRMVLTRFFMSTVTDVPDTIRQAPIVDLTSFTTRWLLSYIQATKV